MRICSAALTATFSEPFSTFYRGNRFYPGKSVSRYRGAPARAFKVKDKCAVTLGTYIKTGRRQQVASFSDTKNSPIIARAHDARQTMPRAKLRVYRAEAVQSVQTCYSDFPEYAKASLCVSKIQRDLRCFNCHQMRLHNR